jgi:soluble lytic murein transglycosylase
VLTLVAYNAGPRRAKEWVADYGDLRSAKVDPIDWVESIPFQETRQYVQKVLQNTHIYRSRLTPAAMHGMTADLRRGSPGSIAVANTAELVLPKKARILAAVARSSRRRSPTSSAASATDTVHALT